MADSLKRKTVVGVLWSAVDRFSAQGLAFVFSILIARVLLPEDYGVVAMLEIFLAIAQTFIDSGFSNALIRKYDRSEADYNTVFYFNMVISILSYCILFFCAPLISRFYDMPLLTPITRVVSLRLVINAFGSIQGVKLSIELNFKSRAKIRIITSCITGAVGVYLAYSGFGVWAIVWQQIVDSFIGAFALWLIVKWRPRLMFSWTSLSQMFSYGSKLLISGIIGTLYNNIYSLVIGKKYSSADLGSFSKAISFACFPANNISGVVNSVAFPAMSSIQNDKGKLTEFYLQIIRTTMYLVVPITIGIAAVADPLVRTLLTDSWTDLIPLLQIQCFAMIWIPIQGMNSSVLQALGRSDYFLRMAVINRGFGILILIVTMPFGVTAMTVGGVVSALQSVIVNSYYVNREIGVSFMKQLFNLRKIFTHSMIMCVLAYFATFMFDNHLLALVVSVGLGAAYYLLASYIFKFEEITSVIKVLFSKV